MSLFKSNHSMEPCSNHPFRKKKVEPHVDGRKTQPHFSVAFVSLLEYNQTLLLILAILRSPRRSHRNETIVMDKACEHYNAVKSILEQEIPFHFDEKRVRRSGAPNSKWVDGTYHRRFILDTKVVSPYKKRTINLASKMTRL